MTLAVLQIIQLMDKPVCPFCVGVLKACWNLTLNQENEHVQISQLFDDIPDGSASSGRVLSSQTPEGHAIVNQI